MARMIVIANKMNRRSAPVSNMIDKSNIIDTVSMGFSFDSVGQTFNAAGTWYEDSAKRFYWGGALIVDTTSAPDTATVAGSTTTSTEIQASSSEPALTQVQPAAPTSTTSASPVHSGLTPDAACFNFIKEHEGLRLHAYQDSAGIWTIGYGTIMYEDNRPVKKGDGITADLAEKLLQGQIVKKSVAVTAAVSGTAINQNQYNALVSFAYNAGTGALLKSTLLRRVKANPADATIRDAFLMWDKATVDGVLTEVSGLKQRREDEADLYFS
jgi:lysozyme